MHRILVSWLLFGMLVSLCACSSAPAKKKSDVHSATLNAVDSALVEKDATS